MQCHEFIEIAGAWMEGEHPAAARAHVDSCIRCRGLVADLTAIQATAGQLDAEVEPPARLWTSIRTQLEAEGILREPSANWTERLAEFFRPTPQLGLAGAYLMLVLVAATVISLDSNKRYEEARGLSVRPPEVADALKLTGERIVTSFPARNPLVAASYRDSLRTIDSAILECEKAMQRDPQNEMAREYLYQAYQQKAELLTAMVERGSYGDK